MIQLLIASLLVIGFSFCFVIYCALANKKPTPAPPQKCDVIHRYQPELNYQERQWHAMRYEKANNLPAVINSMTNRAPASH
jgi:hypothetical protein